MGRNRWGYAIAALWVMLFAAGPVGAAPGLALAPSPALEDPRGFSLRIPVGASITRNGNMLVVAPVQGGGVAVTWSAVFDEGTLLGSSTSGGAPDPAWQRVGKERLWIASLETAQGKVATAATFHPEVGALSFVAADTPELRAALVAIARAVRFGERQTHFEMAHGRLRASVDVPSRWFALSANQAGIHFFSPPARQIVVGLEPASADAPSYTPEGFEGGPWQRDGAVWARSGRLQGVPARMAAVASGTGSLVILDTEVTATDLPRVLASVKLSVPREDPRATALRQRLSGRRVVQSRRSITATSTSNSWRKLAVCPDGRYFAEPGESSLFVSGRFGGTTLAREDHGDQGRWQVLELDDGGIAVDFAGQSDPFRIVLRDDYTPSQLQNEEQLLARREDAITVRYLTTGEAVDCR